MSIFADVISSEKIPTPKKKKKRKSTTHRGQDCVVGQMMGKGSLDSNNKDSDTNIEDPVLVAQRKAGLDITPKGFAYLKSEEIIFDSMTKGELLVRLERIRNPAKLRAFILTAINRNSEELLTEGCRLARKLGYGYMIPRSASLSVVSEKDIGIGKEVPSTRKIRTE